MSERVISASEIGQYSYCARAWWLGSVEELPSSHREAMEAGEAAHRRHGRRVKVSLVLKRLAYGMLVLAVVLIVVMVMLR